MAIPGQSRAVTGKVHPASMRRPHYRRSRKPEPRPVNNDQLVALFLLLADQWSIPLIELISQAARTIPECAGHMKMAGSAVRSQLSHLEQLGLVRRDGELYAVADHRMAEFICLARSLAANNADALLRCHQLKKAPL